MKSLSPLDARQPWRRGQDPAQRDKVMPMDEAVRRFVPDGAQVYVAGFSHAIACAAGHEIIRQRKRDLAQPLRVQKRGAPSLHSDVDQAG